MMRHTFHHHDANPTFKSNGQIIAIPLATASPASSAAC